MGCYKLNKVLIKNATTICADAFNLCRSLKKIHLPESIRVIRKNAFDSTLEDLVLPVGLEKIAFKGSKLEKSSCRIVFKCDDVLFSRSAEKAAFLHFKKEILHTVTICGGNAYAEGTCERIL